MRKKRLAIGSLGILGLIVLLLVLIFFNPYKLNSTLEFTAEHLIIGVILLILLRTLSNVVPAIPGGMIIFSAVPLIGWLTAFICNVVGILLGTSIAFFLARIYREPLVSRFASINKIKDLGKQVSGKRQFMALVAFRLFTVPVVDISSYAIGLTKINYIKFVLATFIAILPTIATFYFGEEIYKRIFGKNLFVTISAVLILGSIYFIIKRYKTKFKINPFGKLRTKLKI
ncbi:MAG: VTT domain-containing protein [Candidatus Levybacteria bacterium]|nr:VTT domain-containing protein [Candidatus Levybacteria bacterium]